MSDRLRFSVLLSDGLGNRLVALAWAKILADHLGWALSVQWPISPGVCECTFGDLFGGVEAPGFEVVDDIDPARASVETCIDEGVIAAIRAGEKRTLILRGVPSIAGVSGSEIQQRASSALRSLRVRPEIEAMRRNRAGDRFGLHIRSTDHLPAQVATPRSVYRAVLAWIHRSFPQERVHVFGDSHEQVLQVTECFPVARGGPVVAQTRPEMGRGSLHGARRALADLLDLAACRTIFASPYSTFSESASLVGACSLRTLVIQESLGWGAARRLLWRVMENVEYSGKLGYWHPAKNRPVLPALVCTGIARFFTGPVWQDWLTRTPASLMSFDQVLDV